MATSNVNIIGHRGAAGYEYENTLLSIEHAITMGVYAVELDVHAHGDELLVIHDDTLDRTTNGSGSIHQHQLETIRELDAGGGQKIPFLQEAIDQIDGRAITYIELKNRRAALLVARLIDRYAAKGLVESQFIVSSFDHIALAWFRGLMPHVRTGALVEDIPTDYAACATTLQAQSINPSTEYIDEQLVDDAKNRGLEIHAYTANDELTIRRMRNMGVTAIFSDYPDLARDYAA